MIDLDRAKEMASAWIDAWNKHDIEVILDHYAEPLEFVSPLVVRRTGRADGTIRTKADLAAYFAPSLGEGSTLHFELMDVYAGVGSITIVYRNHRAQRVAETMFPDEDGRARRVYVHHLPQK